MALFESQSASEPFLVYPDSPASDGHDARVEAGDFFSTLLDIVNPLQHIPVVSNLYREITGDEISPAARMIGGAMFGGPIGFASASANVLLEQTSGEDVMGHALAMLSDEPADGIPGAAPGPLRQQAGDPGARELAHANVDVIAEDIVWSAPRIVPSLAGPDTGAPPVELASAVTPRPAPAGGRSLNAPVAAPVATTTPPTDTPTTDTVPPAPTPAAVTQSSDSGTTQAPPQWLAAAMKDAASAESALQNGNAPVFTEAKPWVANAILDALDKYEALARTRTQGAPNPDDRP